MKAVRVWMVGGAIALVASVAAQSSPNGFDRGTSEYLADRSAAAAGWQLVFSAKGPAWTWPTILLNADRRSTPVRGALVVLDKKRSLTDLNGYEATGFVGRIEHTDGKGMMRVRRYVGGVLGGLLELGGWSEQVWTLRLVRNRPGFAKFDWLSGEYRVLGYFVEKAP